MSPDWAAKAEPVPYAKMDNPQSLNLYAYVGNNPLDSVDLDGHLYKGTTESGGGAGECNDPDSCGHNPSLLGLAGHATWLLQQAQQQYGRQADGSYKADPANVQGAIAAGKPIHEPGNPDKSSECAFACKFLAQMKNIGTGQWRKGRPAVELNDSTDVGLAIATLGSGKYPSQHGNSGIYMGHDGHGNIKIVDQWPNNGSTMDHLNEHLLLGSGIALDPKAYFVILVPKP